MDRQLYAQVILPLPLEGNFTYSVPPAMADVLRAGMRVAVPFGKKRFYTGVVASVSGVKPTDVPDIKPVALLLDTEPSVTNQQMRFWEWMAEYYLCTVGEVFKAALPAGLKIESETRVEVGPDIDPEAFAACSPAENDILAFIRTQGQASVESIEKKMKLAEAGTVVSQLVDKGLLTVSEKIGERFRAVKKPYVRLLVERGSADALDTAFAAVKKSPKQEEALTALVALSEFYRTDRPLVEVPLDVLCERADVTRAVVRAMAEKGLVEVYGREISRFSYVGAVAPDMPVLTPAQRKAHDAVLESFSEKAVTLLHGVTGSGKTEIYIHLIRRTLDYGRCVLFLVPEIALTTQLTTRLQKVFGEKVLIYHSKFSDNERVEMWRRVLASREPLVVVGARSAVFLPFRSLGLVIVDEEHESSYKQYSPAPRYNGRDSAVMLASMFGAKTLYGSATPSIETYYKAREGRFGLVELLERYDGVALPAVEIVDMKAERRRKAVDGYLSRRLVEVSSAAVAAGKQVILFHNRRGYSPLARCSMCAFTPKCDFCDVSLTYHKHSNRLECHYCGAAYPVPQVCPECKEPAIEIVGWGTERLEEEVAEAFDGRRVLRMDLDTTRNKDGYSRIIDDFSQHKADILVGTQMVTKGLDFGAVEVVGVLNADMLVNFPDFRSAERAFNMIEQVAGRAGRRDGKGRVLVQTYDPSHILLHFAAAHDYKGFYEHELAERRAFNYPPFTRIINIYVKHRSASVAADSASRLAASLRNAFGQRVSGPKEPPVARVQMLYIRQIMLKLETGFSLRKVKEFLRAEYVRLASDPTMRSLSVHYDVDPV